MNEGMNENVNKPYTSLHWTKMRKNWYKIHQKFTLVRGGVKTREVGGGDDKNSKLVSSYLRQLLIVVLDKIFAH